MTGAGALAVTEAKQPPRPPLAPQEEGTAAADGERPPPSIYSFGYNSHGQLGLNDQLERSAPRPVRALPSNHIRAIIAACGSSHSLIVDQHGGVFSWGSNAHGQLGTGDVTERSEPTKISCDGQRINGIACGSAHTLLCTSRGRVLACGSNADGQLGLATGTDTSSTSIRSSTAHVLMHTSVAHLHGTRIVGVACGFSHSLFLSRPGGVLSCGANASGQCGHGITTDCYSPPSTIEALMATACSAIACGNFHSVTLTREDGGVYTWGEGRFGRLGHGAASSEFLPRLVGALSGVRVMRVACGGACTAAVDEAGSLWTWGSQTWGQCGHGGAGSDETTPRVVSALEGYTLREVACAEDHMVGVTADGEVLSWGRACNGRLGSDTPFDSAAHLTTPAMAATAAALGRGATPSTKGHAIGITSDASISSSAGRSGATSARGSPLVLSVRLPYLDGLGTGMGDLQPGPLVGRWSAFVHHEDSSGGIPSASPAALPRVAAIACGGAHTLILCGDAGTNGAGTKKKSRRAAVALQCILDAGSGGRGSVPPNSTAEEPSIRPGSSSPGQRVRAVAGVPLQLQVCARDSKGIDCALAAEQRFSVALVGRTGGLSVQPVLSDLGDGVFALAMEETRAGSYDLHVRLHSNRDGKSAEAVESTLGDGLDDVSRPSGGGVPIGGSPISIVVSPAEVSAEHSTVSGPCVTSGYAVAGDRAVLTITPADRFRNVVRRATEGILAFEVFAKSTARNVDSVVASVAAAGDGSYKAVLMPTVGGRFAVFCRLKDVAVGDSPFFVDVVPGPASAAACAVRGLTHDEQRPVDEPIEFTVHVMDTFGNARPSGADRISVQVSGEAGDFAVEKTAREGGVYACSGVPRAAGKIFISVLLDGSQRLPRTPVRLFAVGSHNVDISDMAIASVTIASSAHGLAVDALRQRLFGAHLELCSGTSKAAIEGEPSRLDVKLSLMSGDHDDERLLRDVSTLSEVVTLSYCQYEGPDHGNAVLTSVSTAPDGRACLHFELTPHHAGYLQLRAALAQPSSPAHGRMRSGRTLDTQNIPIAASPPPNDESIVGGGTMSAAHQRVRVFAAASWSFYQLGVLSTAHPFAPMPDRFYELPPPTTRDKGTRPFALLEELKEASVDQLPTVLLVDVGNDARLDGWLAEATALLSTQPPVARCAMLSLLVSSWLGGHRVSADRADGGDAHDERAADEADEQRWRREHASNVRPLGAVRRGGLRPRALLYKLVHDRVVAPMQGEGSCELRRARGGNGAWQLECWLHDRGDSDQPPQPAELYCS